MDATITARNVTTSADPDPLAFGTARRWAELRLPQQKQELLDRKAQDTASLYQRNIENYIGTVSVPVGLAGPLKINGESGPRSYQVPLATTEAALVASYNRGAGILTAAGGCHVRVVDEGVSRTPMFAFACIAEAQAFATQIAASADRLKALVPSVTRHGRLISVDTVIEGNHVYLDLRFSTGDAAGQNMVTFAADLLCKAILENAPVEPRYWFLEANLSGDKKATSRTLAAVRGKRVIAEISLPAQLVRDGLHTTAEHMVEYWCAGAMGGVLSGTTGVQGHFANGLAAIYLACGQDIACVAESATGITRMETTDDGGLYVAVTLPNIIVGTVGGGTALPSAKACLDILGLAGSGNATAFAEVCAGVVLAGEISIIGAFCSGDFAAAHESLSRKGCFDRGDSDD